MALNQMQEQLTALDAVSLEDVQSEHERRTHVDINPLLMLFKSRTRLTPALRGTCISLKISVK